LRAAGCSCFLTVASTRVLYVCDCGKSRVAVLDGRWTLKQLRGESDV
jgi:hypothetical protein